MILVVVEFGFEVVEVDLYVIVMVVDVVGLFDIVLFCDCVVVMLIWYFNLWVSFLYGNLSWFV